MLMLTNYHNVFSITSYFKSKPLPPPRPFPIPNIAWQTLTWRRIWKKSTHIITHRETYQRWRREEWGHWRGRRGWTSSWRDSCLRRNPWKCPSRASPATPHRESQLRAWLRRKTTENEEIWRRERGLTVVVAAAEEGYSFERKWTKLLHQILFSFTHLVVSWFFLRRVGTNEQFHLSKYYVITIFLLWNYYWAILFGQLIALQTHFCRQARVFGDDNLFILRLAKIFGV